VVDFYYQPDLEIDISKRDRALLASAERSAGALTRWLRGAGVVSVEMKVPAEMLSFNDHDDCKAVFRLAAGEPNEP
jgi:hypothetical protein